MEKPLLSIIVPVYNAEKHLPCCIESILCQTYRNLELILINDGSSDLSGQICNEYAKEDTRIIAVHKKNAGVSEARNDGIKISSGMYLQFVDSDDSIDEDMTEILMDAALHNGSDIVICGFKRIYHKTGKSVPISYFQPEMNLEFERFLTIYDDLYLTGYLNAPWNKLYKANVIKDNKIYFNPKLDLGEDLIFNLDTYKKCNNFAILDLCPYNYVNYDTGENLKNRYRPHMYEIQNLLFNQVIALYNKDLNNYSIQINKLKQAYIRTLIIGVIPYIAIHTSLKNYNTFKEKVMTVRRDETLKEHRIINYKSNSKQERLLVFFLRHDKYLSLFLYTKIKELLRNRFPRMFKYFRKIGGNDE